MPSSSSMKGESLTANDPHGMNVEWGTIGDAVICWKGEWARGLFQPYWSSDLSHFIVTRERVRLWVELQNR